jgi:putative ABC transport system substrate-binding protein
VIVATDYDPLAHGYVTSLARPSGNVTGVFPEQIELARKRLQIFKEALPDLQTATIIGGSMEGNEHRCGRVWIAARRC